MIWYLFIKEYDYQFKFEANSGPAAVYQEIKNLDKFETNEYSKKIVTEKAIPFTLLVQRFDSRDSSISLEWNFKYYNDSLTRIEVNTVDHNNKLRNRLEILNPFQQSEYVKVLAQKFGGIKQGLDAIQQTYFVRINEVSNSPDFNCLCVSSINIPVEQKAIEMLESIEVIESYFVKYDLKLKEYPFLKVTNWNIAEETINFDFCFPVEIIKDLEESNSVKMKNYPGIRSLKATYFGNYRQSHLAWYELLEKSRRDNIEIEPKPLEIYFNNPRMGEDAIFWKAEIFMPIKSN